MKKDDFGRFASMHKRTWDKKYTRCIFSNDCKKVLMVYTIANKLHMDAGLSFDAYDVSDMEFYSREEPISPDDSSFLFTYSHSASAKELRKLKFEFSQDDDFILIRTKTKLKLLPMPADGETEFS